MLALSPPGGWTHRLRVWRRLSGRLSYSFATLKPDGLEKSTAQLSCAGAQVRARQSGAAGARLQTRLRSNALPLLPRGYFRSTLAGNLSGQALLAERPALLLSTSRGCGTPGVPVLRASLGVGLSFPWTGTALWTPGVQTL